MVTISSLVSLLGFWLAYQSSDRAALGTSKNQLESWARSYRQQMKVVSICVLFSGLLSYVYALGVGAGSMAFVMTISVLGSLVVLISPLRLVSRRMVLVLYVVSFCLEMAL
ncbi:hypothetical protein [Marinoscillum furvescens]|nr:hypothetical protein [Marinoscillum furvescens]